MFNTLLPKIFDRPFTGDGCIMTRSLRAFVSLSIALLCFKNTVAAQADAPVKSFDANPETGTSTAVFVNDVPLVHTAQFLPLDNGGNLVGKGDPAAQIEQVMANLSVALAEARSDFDRLVKINVYVTRPETADMVKKTLAKKFRGEIRPASSFVVGTLPHPDALVAMDAIAVAESASEKRVKHLTSPKLLRGDSAHAAVLPTGGRVYISGFGVMGKDFEEATRKSLEGLRAVLKYLNLSGRQVVQAKAFLTPMSKINDVRKEMVKFFGEGQVPPLVFVEWQSTLPIEIELIASTDKERKDGEVLEYLTPTGMQGSPLFSRVVRINRGPTLFISGLYGMRAQNDPAEVGEIFSTLETLLSKAGSDFRHLAKATYYITSEEASKKLNELRAKYYDPARPPAASKAMVTSVGINGKRITLDMIATPAPKR